MSTQINFTLTDRLEPNTAYGASASYTKVDGSSAELGFSDQTSDEKGHVVFELSPAVLVAVANAGGGGTLKAWVRAAGSEQDAPPVNPHAVAEVVVA